MKRDLCPEYVDDLLHEWAFYFRDRRRFESCRSIEGRFRAHSEDYSAEGWGANETPPQKRTERMYSMRRALLTHEAIQGLDKTYKWALTYHYAFPGLPRFLVLRMMKKYTGRQFTWKAFGDVLDIARMRVYTLTTAFSRNAA